MQLKWMDKEKTILSVNIDEHNSIIVEPHMDEWEHYSNEENIEDFVEDKDDIIETIKNKRKMAFEEYSDPLFFKYQRDEIDKQVWLDAVEEIKMKYPYPDDKYNNKHA